MNRWTYSPYRAALRLDGRTVALLTPDGRNAFGNGQVQPLLDALNKDAEKTELFAKLNSKDATYTGPRVVNG